MRTLLHRLGWHRLLLCISDHIRVFVLHRACEDLILWIICMKVFYED